MNQSVSERCQRQSVKETPEAKDQDQVRLQKTSVVHLFHESLLNVYNVLGTVPVIGNTEVNKDMSIKG